MGYKLNSTGREAVRNFIKNNAFTNKCSNEFFQEAEERANQATRNSHTALQLSEGAAVVAAVLLPHETIHRYEVMLVLRGEHYDYEPCFYHA